MLGCRVFGHRYRFRAEGAELIWLCQRECGAGGRKTYATSADADRYAREFDREDRQDLGRRAPLVGLLPLRLWQALRRR